MKGKRYVSMLLPRKDCQLDFNGLLVYSYLTYLTRHKRTASQKAIGAALGLHRVTTVRKARLIAAGYKATDILEVWDHAWQTLNCKCLRMECYAFHFWKILETVEKETQRNRRTGVVDGPNSKGLLKARTDAFGRRLEDRLRRDGLGSLLGWEPGFEKMNGEVTANAGT